MNVNPNAGATTKPRRPLSEREKARRRLARKPGYVTRPELIQRERHAQQQRAALAELAPHFWRLCCAADPKQPAEPATL